MFYAMIYGTLPFSHSNDKELIKMIRLTPVKFPPGTPITHEGKEIIKHMLAKDPNKRLQLIDLVQAPYAIMEPEEFDPIY